MIQSLLSRVLTSLDAPTADLYFLNACADLIGNGVEQISPTVFASQAACLVIRHDQRAGRLPPRRRLIYLIDDDVDAGQADNNLPYFYRQKLRIVEGATARRLRRYAGVAVVGSPALADVYRPVMETHLLCPYWSEPMGGTAHFKALSEDGWTDMGYLGSSAHRGDLAFLLPVVQALLAGHPKLRFHLPAEHRLPPDLDGHPRVLRISGPSWSGYRRELVARRFHIALYPLLDTPFNRSRSPNKLIEHGIVGAAPVYSQSWDAAGRAVAAGAGLAAANDQRQWFEAVSALLADPARIGELSRGAQRLGSRMNDPAPQRDLWHSLLGLRAQVAA